MFKRTLVTSAAAAAIIAAAGLAYAQAPSGQSGSQGMGSERSTGQAPGLQNRTSPPPGAGQGSERSQERTTGQTTESTTGSKPGDKPSTAQSGDKPGDKPSSSAQSGSKPGDKPGDKPSSAQTGSKPGDKPSSAQTGADKPGSSTAGTTGSTGGSANVTTEQQKRLSSAVHNVQIRETSNVNVSISVGTVLPSTIELVAVPAPIIEIVPAFRSYRAIRVGGRILIVEPDTRRIVYIINV